MTGPRSQLDAARDGVQYAIDEMTGDGISENSWHQYQEARDHLQRAMEEARRHSGNPAGCGSAPPQTQHHGYN